MNKDKAIRILCDTIEKEFGRKMKTPKDFNTLAANIFEKLHETVSPTTLKRMWGYLSEPVSPRLSTLDILSQYVGYGSWQEFCEKEVTKEPEALPETPTQEEPTPASQSLKDNIQLKYLLIFIALVIIVGGSFLFINRTNSNEQGLYILKKGQKFQTYHDYLKLFGITDTVRYWGKVHPKYPNISIWGPEYHNPHWHNEGDPSQMMPTITERWAPPGEDPKLITIRNRDNYNHERRVNEVRITFMKNLVDSGFVFLGVYRMAVTQSDTTHCVWERILEECDLNNLDYLETLRN